jgi:hypothetical protein
VRHLLANADPAGHCRHSVAPEEFEVEPADRPASADGPSDGLPSVTGWFPLHGKAFDGRGQVGLKLVCSALWLVRGARLAWCLPRPPAQPSGHNGPSGPWHALVQLVFEFV